VVAGAYHSALLPLVARASSLRAVVAAERVVQAV